MDMTFIASRNKKFQNADRIPDGYFKAQRNSLLAEPEAHLATGNVLQNISRPAWRF
jgi:hypothetical protein